MPVVSLAPPSSLDSLTAPLYPLHSAHDGLTNAQPRRRPFLLKHASLRRSPPSWSEKLVASSQRRPRRAAPFASSLPLSTFSAHLSVAARSSRSPRTRRSLAVWLRLTSTASRDQASRLASSTLSAMTRSTSATARTASLPRALCVRFTCAHSRSHRRRQPPGRL